MNGETVELIFSGLLTYFVHSSVFLLAALCLTSAWFVRHVATKELIWRTALIFGLVTAPLQTLGLLDPLVEPIVLDRPIAQVAPSTATQAQVALPATPGKAAALDAELSSRSIEPGKSVNKATTGIYAWLVFTLLLIAQLSALAFKLKRQIKGRREISDSGVLTRVETLARELGIPTPRLTAKSGLSSPFCLPGGEIVLPDWALEMQPEQQSAMLAHELAHLKRHDPAWLIAGRAIQAVAFFQPLNRVANRKLGELSEFACDAWSKRLCRSGLALAECLAECARRQSGQMPAELGIAMADRRSPILERTRLLLDHHSDESGPAPMTTRLLIITMFVAVALLLPAFAAGEKAASGGASHGEIEVTSSGSIAIENDGFVTLNTVVKSEGRKLSLEGKGRFQFNDEETEMVSMSPDGFLDIEEHTASGTRRVRFEASSGQVVERFWDNGSKTEKSAAMRNWLAKVIPDFYRATGLDAENRTRRLHALGGVGRVLDEIALIPGSYTRRSYASVLASLGQFTDGETDRFMGLAAGHLGSYDLRETLVVFAQEQDPSEQEWQAFARAASAISSSYDLRETLAAASEKLHGSAETWDALLDAADGISSSYDLREALTAYRESMPKDAKVMSRWADTARKISSSFDLRETISAYAKAGGFESGGWLALLDATENISSSFDKREALVSIARNMPREVDLVDRYHQVASGISSGFDREQAEEAL